VAVEESPRLVSQGTRRGGMASPGPGIVLECTNRGTLLKIQRDDLGLLQSIAPGISFLHLMARESLDKAFAFLAELKNRESAFGCELKVSLACQPTTLHVAGIAKAGLLMIFGTRTRGELLRFSRYFMDNGLLKSVRRAIRGQIGLSPGQGKKESALHEKLCCAENKLVNLQRVLAKKNVDLKRVSAELRAARKEIPTLQDFLPICSCCKKIRDEQGSWNHVETFFKNHIGVQFTHSICPECAQTLYPGLRLEI
jgi:hypothetical protein